MINAIIGVAVILALIGFAIWVGRPKLKGGNGDNRDSATRYGAGYHGP